MIRVRSHALPCEVVRKCIVVIYTTNPVDRIVLEGELASEELEICTAGTASSIMMRIKFQKQRIFSQAIEERRDNDPLPPMVDDIVIKALCLDDNKFVILVRLGDLQV